MKWGCIPACLASAYSLLGIVAAVRWRRRRVFRNHELPPVSVLKPLCGAGPHLYAALRSQVLQDYPDYEILLCPSSSSDPIPTEIERLKREFPSRHLRVVLSHTAAANPKVGALEALAEQASNEFLVFQDDDIVAGPGVLKSLLAPFADGHTGLVTCLYRGHARSFAARLEALGIVSDFVPRVIVARLPGFRDFAVGARCP